MKQTAGATSTCWGDSFCQEDYRRAENWAEKARVCLSGWLVPMVSMVLLEISECSLQNWVKQTYGQNFCPKLSPPFVPLIQYSAQTVRGLETLWEAVFSCLFAIPQALNTFFLGFSVSSSIPAARKMQKGILDLKLSWCFYYMHLRF